MAEREKLKIYRSLFYPALLVLLLWIIRLSDAFFDLGLNRYGLYPLQTKGLLGILTSPFLHADLVHLFANSAPLLILGALLFYFYREIAWTVLAWLVIITGFWVWTLARGSSAHIGASGVIYGLASFLIFSGIIRREASLMVITLLVTFIYGGLIWGIFPQFFPNKPISWESHGMGFLAGIVLAVFYRDRGLQRKRPEWDESEEDDDDPNAYWMKGSQIETEESTRGSDNRITDSPSDRPPSGSIENR